MNQASSGIFRVFKKPLIALCVLFVISIAFAAQNSGSQNSKLEDTQTELQALLLASQKIIQHRGTDSSLDKQSQALLQAIRTRVDDLLVTWRKIVLAKTNEASSPNRVSSIHDEDDDQVEQLVAKLAPTRNLPGPIDNDRHRHKQFPWPIEGEIVSAPGSALRSGGAKWPGLLIHTEPTTTVRAIAAGEVVYAGKMKNLGLLIIVDHNDGYLSLYGRYAKRLVSPDQRVSEHQAIAVMHSSEADAGLYFEIRYQGNPVDPRLLCLSAPTNSPVVH